MKLKTISAAALFVLAAPAFAAIAPGTTGNGELFLVVFDSDAKVSYTLDLGITQNSFGTAGQTDGYSNSWTTAGDSNFTTFLNTANVNSANLQWAVLAVDSTGGLALGDAGNRLFTTVKTGQEVEFAGFGNQIFQTAIGSSQAGTFFNAINTTGTHGVSGQPANYAVNGSSVNKDTDTGNAYFGDGSVGLSSNLNGNAPFSVANAVGTASAFYSLTRSSAEGLDPVQVDVFGTDAGALGTFSFAASTGVVASYTLSYTLVAQPVPEPGTYALLLAGLAAVGVASRRRRNA